MGIHSSLPLINNITGIAAAEKSVGEGDQKQVAQQPALPTGSDGLAEQRAAGNAAAKRLYRRTEDSAKLKGQHATATHPEDEAGLKEMKRQLVQLDLPADLAPLALEGLKHFNVKTVEELKDRILSVAMWSTGHPQKELAMNIIQECEPLEKLMREEQDAFKGRNMVHPGLMMHSGLVATSA